MKTDSQNACDMLDMLPFLKEAALRKQPGAADQLEKLSHRRDEVGIAALAMQGELLLCDPTAPGFDVNLVVGKLSEAAGLGSDGAVQLLLGLPRRSVDGFSRSRRKEWLSRVSELGDWSFWEPVFAKRAELENRTEKCLSLARFLSDDETVGKKNDRQLTDFLRSIEGDKRFRDGESMIRMVRATLLCRRHLSGNELEEGAGILADMASNGNKEARKTLLEFVKRKDQDTEVFVRNVARIADLNGDGSYYFWLGKTVKTGGAAFFQKGALMGNPECRLEILRLRLVHPQADLLDAQNELECLRRLQFERDAKIQLASVLGLFVKRCQEAIEVEKSVIEVCRDSRFLDNPHAKIIIDRFDRLSQWIERYNKKTLTDA